MSAAVIDIATIRARRAAAAAAAAAAQKRDPFSNPRVVLIVQLLLSQLILAQAAGRIVAMTREISIISNRRPS